MELRRMQVWMRNIVTVLVMATVGYTMILYCKIHLQYEYFDLFFKFFFFGASGYVYGYM